MSQLWTSKLMNKIRIINLSHYKNVYIKAPKGELSKNSLTSAMPVSSPHKITTSQRNIPVVNRTPCCPIDHWNDSKVQMITFQRDQLINLLRHKIGQPGDVTCNSSWHTYFCERTKFYFWHRNRHILSPCKGRCASLTSWKNPKFSV